jgi:hypothetical protein
MEETMKATVRNMGFVGALLIFALQGPPASADPIATGTVTLTVQGSSGSGAFVFDDAPFTAFGTPVNFGGSSPSGSFVGSMTYTEQIMFTGPNIGITTLHADSVVPGRLSEDAAVNFVCTFSGQYQCSVVGTLTNLVGSVASFLPSGLVYVSDATTTGDGTTFSGVFAVNAFLPVGTPTGTNVTVPTNTTFVDSATNTTVPLAVTVTYPNVTNAGSTTVTAMSNVAGQVPANLSFNTGASFLDISTTAVVDTSGAPITVCVDYSIAGAVADPAQLRLLHNVNGTWVDVTSSIDTGAGIICGTVSSLSPFGVAVAAGCPFAPANDCQGAASGKASLVLGEGKLTWKWKSLNSVLTSDFGNPVATTDYELCVYDHAGEAILDTRAAGGATCGTGPCWKTSGTTGFKYSSRDGSPEGLTAIQLKAGLTGNAKIAAKGKGVDLVLPPLPLTAPVVAQVRRTDTGACWGAVYSAPTRNSSSLFKAKSD